MLHIGFADGSGRGINNEPIYLVSRKDSFGLIIQTVLAEVKTSLSDAEKIASCLNNHLEETLGWTS